ncbi:unannotated protein [freshwater metagenome]|uniref:Unannotated protein n=1 Tax=freshwater metagenome TaxID=449393 RepID=A0A6J7APX0_9ZZZZ
MAAGGSYHRHTCGRQRVGQVGRAADAVAQVVRVDHFCQTLGDGLQIASGEPAVGGEALGEDQHVAALHGECVVVHRQPAADVGHPILLGAHRHPVGERADVAHDVDDRAILLTLFTFVDEPRVLGKSAAVQEQRQVVLVAHGTHGAQVGQRHRLAATGVVGDGDEHDGDVLRAASEDQFLERDDIHVALERVLELWALALGDHQVDGLSAGELDVRPGGVEVGVVGDHFARAADHREQDLLGGAALVCGDHVLEREQVLHRGEEAVPRR